MKKVFIALAAILCFSQAAFAYTYVPQFSDVMSGHPQVTAINWLADQGVVIGYSDGTFRPEQIVNRAEFLKMLYEVIGLEGLAPFLPFSDVPKDEWYTKYVREAYSTEVAVGYPDGFFRPGDPINFAEATKIVMNGFFDVDSKFDSTYNECKDGQLSPLDTYPNVDTTAWYWKFLQVADELCIFDTQNNNEIAAGFNLDAKVTRGNMAEMLYRAQTVKDRNLDTYNSSQTPYTLDIREPGYYNTTYINELLNLSFRYPSEWGDIAEEPDGDDHVALSVLGEGSIIILAADNGLPSVPRGGYWGDTAGVIDTQQWVQSYCDGKANCEIRTNQHGVIFAKSQEEIFSFGGTTVDFQYYIYNPLSDFRGIVISAKRLRAEGLADIEHKLDILIDSLQFFDDRPLIGAGLPMPNVDDRCAERFYAGAPTETINFSDTERGLSLDLPYNPSWGSVNFSTTPYDDYDDHLSFGPMVGFEACSWPRSYSLSFNPVSPSDQVMNQLNISLPEGVLLSAPETVIINELEVVKYSEAGLCSYPTMVVIGDKHNYTFSPLCAGDHDEEFAFMETIINSITLIE